ncbi:MAG TPA: alpha/beta hydrolase [Polyangiaceae bacterium]|nr:alpha/beta hydrolase [Polyangiaceae bacterium]
MGLLAAVGIPLLGVYREKLGGAAAEGANVQLSGDSKGLQVESAPGPASPPKTAEGKKNYGDVLGKIVDFANDLIFGDRAPSADTGGIPKPGTDATAVRTWWNGLPESERQRLIQQDPAAVGQLDGVPAAARDEANRILLARAPSELKAQQEALQAELRRELASPSANMSRVNHLHAEIERVQRNIQGVEALNDRLSHTGGEAKGQALLLGFDTRGEGHAIVASGDPDHAGNVVTYVPGTTAKLAGIGGDQLRSDRMANRANEIDPASHTVGVTWLGYDAPQSIPSAASDRYAKEGSEALSDFQAGLRATHEGPPSHNTVIGHSYGSTVVGVAAHDHGLSADEMVFVGSPGVGVDHAKDLGIDAQHVWSSHAPNDPIQYTEVGSATGPLIGTPPPSRMPFGINPSSSEFGARTFTSQSGGHSGYWDTTAAGSGEYTASTSLDNIAHIVVGQDEAVTARR